MYTSTKGIYHNVVLNFPKVVQSDCFQEFAKLDSTSLCPELLLLLTRHVGMDLQTLSLIHMYHQLHRAEIQSLNVL